jgi:methionine synthase I (cobalamin-dependent)
MSFDTAGRTMMGVTSADLVKLVEELPNPPLAFGANCGTGSSDLLRTILGFSAQVPSVRSSPRGTRAFRNTLTATFTMMARQS